MCQQIKEIEIRIRGAIWLYEVLFKIIITKFQMNSG